jgi:hypothetical protein
MQRVFLALAATVVWTATFSNSHAESPNSDWKIASHPYRVQIKLGNSASGRAAINVDVNKLIKQLAEEGVDQSSEETFAYEKAVLVDPLSGKVVGGFKLVKQGKSMPIDGDFSGLANGKSPWVGFNPSQMKLESVECQGNPCTALLIKEEEVGNKKVSQPVTLTRDQNYLLEYWIMMDTQDNEIGVMINDPSKQLFAQVPHSYYNKMPPVGEWAQNHVLFRPELDPDAGGQLAASLEVSHAFVGKGGVANLRLQPVEWQLVANTSEPVEALDLYLIGRAGHRFTEIEPEIIANGTEDSIEASLGELQTQDINPEAILVTSGEATAWTIDPILPLKVGTVSKYKPIQSAAAKIAKINTFRNGAASLVIAVDSGTDRLDDLKIKTDLPAKVQSYRLATIPVFDGPTFQGEHKGRLLETRYEAMVPLDYKLDPKSADGIHLVLLTITPTEEADGSTQDIVTLEFADQKLELPVQLNVAPLTISPAKHFETLFGGISFLVGYEAGIAGMEEKTITTAAYHGLDDEGLIPDTVMSLSIPDNPNPRMKDVRELAKKYFHSMLDYHLLPQSPAIYAYYDYDVVDKGEGLAPELNNWDFNQGFDEAVREFVIGRDMRWLMIGRTNGALINRITLNNGKTYSFDANEADPNWVQLPRDEFHKLIGNYWEAVAAHLEELGVLDRAMFVVDESEIHTYDNIYNCVMAMKAQPHAKQIKIGHTIQHASAWTHRLPNGKLLMDEILDVPMPINDEHYNFYEQEWGTRYERPGKTQWVYNVETDHLVLEAAGLSTAFMPLRLQQMGVDGWYCWELVHWSYTYGYKKGDMGGFKYALGPAINPWINPFYHHGPGVLSFYYPPDPRGLPEKPTDQIIPSFRLTLMRDGIELRALLDVLQKGRDDAGKVLPDNEEGVSAVNQSFADMCGPNTVQWYLSYHDYQEARQKLFDLATEKAAE